MVRALAARVTCLLCLVIGVAFLVHAGMVVIQAVQQADEISAYQHARACPAGAASAADCLDRVHGTVAAVTEVPADIGNRLPAVFALNVRTESSTLRLSFESDSPMLGHAVDGDRAVVTMWRGVPVSVVTDGRSDVTTSVPRTAARRDLGDSVEAGCGAAIFIAAPWAIRRKGWTRVVPPSTSPSVIIPPAAVLPSTPMTRTPRRPLLALLSSASWGRVLEGGAVATVIPVLLTVAVVFGGAVTTQDGAAARALRHAPPCTGETNLATCADDFTAVINGVRAPANGANGAEVSFVTASGAINTWATFGGTKAPIAPMASAAENARAQLRIRVWRRSVIGAEFGGSWHWANGDPPDYVIPATLLAVSFALLLFMTRLRVHRRAGSGTDKQNLIADDIGQVSAAAGSVLLAAYGFWAGAILGLAVLAWLGLSVRQSLLSGR
jgi:hypothetical protein